jgi:uncharacterized protein (DUF2252 family)
MIRFDPMALARAQLARDREATRRFPDLFDRKIARMTVSPFAFLRGAAPLFYGLLRDRPSLADGPGGSGLIIGDLHLENFGAYRPADPIFDDQTRHHKTRYEATFGLNDFDDATLGPWRFDLLRVTTSLILAGRELGATGHQVLDMADAMLEAWNEQAHARRSARPPSVPAPAVALIEQVARRTRKELLDARTELKGGDRRFIRGPRYRDLPSSVLKRVPQAIDRYLKSLDEDERPALERMQVVDAAFRIAGTGSLGALRIAVLVTGKGGRDGGWLFDMKEQGAPSSEHLLPPPRRNGAKRVRSALSSCLDNPPQLVGVTKLDGVPMLVRRIAPQEDKLELSRIDHRHLPALARYLGALIGAAHRRGAMRAGRPWKHSELHAVTEKAVTLAGVHEATYLALCKLTR